MRLLFVEDDPLDRELIRRALRASDLRLEVEEAATLKDARQKLGESFDCVLTDLYLPDGEGLELVPDIGNAALVVLTGSAEPRPLESLGQGAQDYLFKDRLDPYWLGRALQYAVQRKQIERLMREVEHRDRLTSLGQLAASIAHDINNPTAFVAANLEVLARLLRDVPEGEDLVLPQAEVSDLRSALVESLSGLSQITNVVRRMRSFARRPNETEPVSLVDLREVVEWAIALTRKQLSHQGRLIEDVGEGALELPARPGRLAQVLTNLLLNAAHATGRQESPVVRLRVRRREAEIHLDVDDSGPGMDDELKRKALEPFFTTKESGIGTGLGLSIAHEIAREHGGRLVLSDSPLGGLRASLILPVETGLSITPDAGHSVQAPERRLRIVVIDDEVSLRRAYERLLRPHEVVSYTSAAAMRWLERRERAHDVDAILCDLMMPDIDGRDLYLATLGADPALASRFIFCSGGVFRRDLRSFLATVPEIPVLVKPVSREAILDEIARLQNGRRRVSSHDDGDGEPGSTSAPSRRR